MKRKNLFAPDPIARIRSTTGLVVLGFAAIPVAVSGQVAPAAVPVVAAGDKVVELSPFEVRAEDDSGYQAMNTTSGSRLATSLKDTAASISPFTPEFLSDIAATNVKNLTNSYLGTTARWNADFSGARRIYLRDLRSWRLTMSVEY